MFPLAISLRSIPVQCFSTGRTALGERSMVRTFKIVALASRIMALTSLTARHADATRCQVLRGITHKRFISQRRSRHSACPTAPRSRSGGGHVVGSSSTLSHPLDHISRAFFSQAHRQACPGQKKKPTLVNPACIVSSRGDDYVGRVGLSTYIFYLVPFACRA